jgi:hypothetical protein
MEHALCLLYLYFNFEFDFGEYIKFCAIIQIGRRIFRERLEAGDPDSDAEHKLVLSLSL